MLIHHCSGNGLESWSGEAASLKLEETWPGECQTIEIFSWMLKDDRIKSVPSKQNNAILDNNFQLHTMKSAIESTVESTMKEMSAYDYRPKYQDKSRRLLGRPALSAILSGL